MQLKVGGKFHLRLNISERPIANKYREGKMKRTLKIDSSRQPHVGKIDPLTLPSSNVSIGGAFRHHLGQFDIL
ncbi:hypothetical protein MELLADRAFT_84117 [Melampsora larici-populina 98AG31]|uniref:Uncharacterized protein n=1 Tax=Melampsora larici-populina (strain 98AG31 / pathotype 3-4-7) TaxID=747676 RepID=F4SBJ7_MELLP|nr:hypothetical protein MELLADRAFT_84117 [Melampsora larici-populina 98AG31]